MCSFPWGVRYFHGCFPTDQTCFLQRIAVRRRAKEGHPTRRRLPRHKSKTEQTLLYTTRGQPCPRTPHYERPTTKVSGRCKQDQRPSKARKTMPPRRPTRNRSSNTCIHHQWGNTKRFPHHRNKCTRPKRLRKNSRGRPSSTPIHQ